MSQPTSALQSILKLNVRIPDPISTQSPHTTNRSNHHQRGDPTEKTHLKTVTMRWRCTPNRDTSVMWGVGVPGFPLMISTKEPVNLSKLSLIFVVEKFRSSPTLVSG